MLGDTGSFGLNVDEVITWKGSGRAHRGRGKIPEHIRRMGKKFHCSGFECYRTCDLPWGPSPNSPHCAMPWSWMGSEWTTVGWVGLHPPSMETPQLHGAVHHAWGHTSEGCGTSMGQVDLHLPSLKTPWPQGAVSVLKPIPTPHPHTPPRAPT